MLGFILLLYIAFAGAGVWDCDGEFVGMGVFEDCADVDYLFLLVHWLVPCTSLYLPTYLDLRVGALFT